MNVKNFYTKGKFMLELDFEFLVLNCRYFLFDVDKVTFFTKDLESPLKIMMTNGFKKARTTDTRWQNP